MVKQKKTKEIDQTKLFDYGFTSNKLHDALKSLDRRISPSQTSVYTHGLHPYVAKFMPHFPNLFINLFSQRNETVLDPFAGSGTVGEVAKELQKDFILIELNPEYIKLIEKRVNKLL